MQYNKLLNSWLKARHISDSVISEFGIHWGANPILGECIVIPVMGNDGNFLFNKYRRNPLVKKEPKYLYDNGGKVTMYGFHKASFAGPSLLITEGEMDCLVAWAANIPAISSTGGAQSFQREWCELLRDKELTLCFDNDQAGGMGMAKTIKILADAGMSAYIVFIPDRPGIKDISDYVASGGDLGELMRTRMKFGSLQEVIDDRARRASLWQSTWFHDAYIEQNTEKEISGEKGGRERGTWEGSELEMAKQYPINNLVKFGRGGSAKCVWHSEKTGSMHYYRESNTVYCFGCSRAGDAIDVYRAIHGCSFKEAIKELI